MKHLKVSTLCHLQEWNRGAPQVDPRRSGILFYTTTLPKTCGCAILRSCLRVSPTTARTRRRRSPNNTGAAVLRSSSPPRGAVKTPTTSGELYRSLHIPKNEYKAAVMQVWNASQCRDQACSSLPEPMLEGPRKSSLPTRANAQKKQERLMTACLCQGFVNPCWGFLPTFIWVSSVYLLYKCLSSISICTNLSTWECFILMMKWCSPTIVAVVF